MGSENTMNKTAVFLWGINGKKMRVILGCALQVSWVPLFLYIERIPWEGLPVGDVLPVAAFFVGCLVAVLFSRLALRDSVLAARKYLDIMACVLFGAGSVLSSTAVWLGQSLLLVHTAGLLLCGLAGGILVMLWVSTLIAYENSLVAGALTVTAVVAGLFCWTIGIIPTLVVLAVSACCVVLSCVLRVCEKLPTKQTNIIESRLLNLKMRHFEWRYVVMFLLLGFCSATMLLWFISSDSAHLITQIGVWGMLGPALFCLILFIGWLPNHEINPFLTLRLLFFVALLTFFPIDPGSLFNFWLVAVMGVAWSFCLYATMLLVSCETNRTYSGLGRNLLGVDLAALSLGVLLGVGIICLVSVISSEFADTLQVNPGSISYICSVSVFMVMAIYCASNIVVRGELLRSLVLASRGGFALSMTFKSRDATQSDFDGKSLPERPVDRELRLVDTCKHVALDYGLTPRELEVLIILAQGDTLARVQSDLVISEGTAITHRRHIYRKLGVHSKQDLLDKIREVSAAEG